MSETPASCKQCDKEGQWSALFLCEAILDFVSAMAFSVSGDGFVVVFDIWEENV